ncbi:MAG: hypothetical protein HUU10_07920 [Bacteroidetes bacterium]|nr:hypothetical protein [Bacteroidota bacterium]
MTADQVQTKIGQLELAIKSEKYDEAESIMKEFMTDFPDYHTPLILYINLHPYIDVSNPLYAQILDLTRQYQQFQDFPADLVPAWYKKISTKNLKLASDEETAVAVESSETGESVDLGDQADVIDQMFPETAPFEEEAEPEIHLVDPHSLVEDDEISDVIEEEAPAAAAEEHPHDPDDEIMIASETMAEIFAQQGKFSKAIRVYEMLIQEEPELADEFNQRIGQLKSLQAAK